MFYGSIFRQTPIGLLVLSAIFVAGSALSSHMTGKSYSLVDFGVTVVIFGFLVLAALSHSLHFRSDGKLKASLLLVVNKVVDPLEGLTAEVKPAYWNNRSRTLVISQGATKLYSINVYDLGFYPDRNAKDLLLRLQQVSSNTLKLDNDLTKFLAGERDIYGQAAKL